MKRRVLHGELAVDGRKWPGDERGRVREAGGSELCGRVVPAIEHVIDLADHLEPAVHQVSRAEIDDGVARGGAGTEVVRAINLLAGWTGRTKRCCGRRPRRR